MATHPVVTVSSEPTLPLVEGSPVVCPAPSNDHPRDVPPPEPWLARAGAWLWRFTFRFGALYFGLFLLGNILRIVPGLGWFGGHYFRLTRQFVNWFGPTVLRVTLPAPVPSGSGDKLYDWVQCAALLSVAAAGALIWVWFDRERKADGLVHDLVRIALRYSLGVTMLSYGMSKVLWQQMPAPSMYRLLGTYGESSPMGILWTFMGQSWAYSAFAGGLEVLGGLLLFFRRTTTLGALLLITVMANVLLMNMTFDVPVKLYSAHYLLFAIVLAGPDLRRLIDVLWFHRTTAGATIRRPWPAGRAGTLLTVAKGLLVASILWNGPIDRTWRWLDTPRPPKSEFYGIYEVESFTRDGAELPPLTTDTSRWRRLGIDEQNRAAIQLMNDNRMTVTVRPGPGPGKLTFEFPTGRNTSRKDIVDFSRPSPEQLVLEGEMSGRNVLIRLKRVDDRKLLLRERGFHWISELPFNR